MQCAIIKGDYVKRVSLLYALAILNSKYIEFLYRHQVLEEGKVFPQVKLKYLRNLPFVLGIKSQQEKVAELAKKMLVLNKELRESTENSNESEKLKSEIEKTDHKIDEEVYKIYELTPEEIKVIET